MNQFYDCTMIVRVAEACGFIRTSKSFSAKVGFSDTELAEKPFLDWIEPGDSATVRAALKDIGKTFQVTHKTKDGSGFPLRIQAVDQGEGIFVLGLSAEAPTRPDPVEESASEATVKSTLYTIARIVEEQNPGFKCSILLVADGCFVSGAGPSLPDDYNAAIDGYAIGPTVGSCGTAIFWNVPVIVEDIQADPLWAPFAELAKKAGVAACWSHPFASRRGQVLGALAFYSPVPRAPTAEQFRQLRAAAALTGLAVERGRAEEALRENRKREMELETQLQQAAKMKAVGELAGGIAHDFNNQLQPILGFSSLLRDSIEDEELREAAEIICQAAKHSSKSIKELLTFAHKSPVVKSTPIDIHNTVAEVVSLLEHCIHKNVKIHQQLSANPSIIVGDPAQIQNMIFNIVLNANDAMPDGGDLVFNTDTVTLQDTAAMPFNPPDGLYARILISDTGIGMDEETRQRVFEPFFTTKGVGKGTGMGLASVYGTVEKHGGTITFESKVGSGTAFTVFLPLTGASKLPGKPADSGATITGTGRILVVDDESSVRVFIERVLTRLGYNVTTAENGREAVDIFLNAWQDIDAVLLDMSMPEMDGSATFHAMREIHPDVKVILSTGFDLTSEAQLLYKEGLKAYIQKPYTITDIAKVLEQVLKLP